MERLTHIDFALGPGGWVKTWWRRGRRERSALVRFAPAKGGQWKIVELRVKDPMTGDLREIPLYRIELAFNAMEMRAELRARLDDDVPGDLDNAIGDFYRAAPRQKLKRPRQHRLDDDFFRSVAFTYREAAIRGLNPGKTIAEDAGVPGSTAARWIAQARDRGFLPPAERGKVSV